MKLYHLIVPFLIIFYSCATVDELAEGDLAEDQTETVDDQRPAWYDYSKRSYADSLNFVGVGLASDVDSGSAHEKALKQAEANLRVSIDSHVEEIRANRAVNTGGDMFGSAEFIINLRNAVQEISVNQMEISAEHVEKSDSVHHVYVKTTIPRQTAIEALNSALQVEEFTHLLQE